MGEHQDEQEIESANTETNPWSPSASGVVEVAKVAKSTSSRPPRRNSSIPPSSTSSRRLLRSQLVAPALMMLRRFGLDPGMLLRDLGLPASAESDASLLLPLETFRTLLHEVDRRLDDPLLAVRLTSHLSPAESVTFVGKSATGLVEYLVQTAPTVGESLQAAARFAQLASDVISIDVEIAANGRMVFRQSIIDEPTCLGAQANEAFLAATLSMFRQMTASSPGSSPFAVTRAWIAHRRERGTAELASALGLSVDAIDDDAGSNGFEIEANVAQLPLNTREPRLHAILRDHAELLLAGRATPSKYLGHVRDIIRERLRHELPTLEEVARALRTSARTLQRRLGEEGSSFQELVESVRSESARELLADHRRSVGQVAFELHYADVSGFVRAFRRWTGATPGEYRTQLLAS